MDSSLPTETAPAPPSMSFPARFAGIFVEPRETLADVVRRPDFLWPLAVSVISGVVLTETMLAKIGMERIIRNQLEQGGQAARMSAEQLEQAVNQGASIAGIIAHIMGVIAAPIVLLIFAAIGLLVLNSFFGAQAKFKTVFSITCYSQLVGVLGVLTGLAVMLFGDVERFNAQNPMPTNLGFFLNPLETSKPLLALAGSLDIFTIWGLILLGIGLSEASGRKVKAKSIFLVYAGLWAVWIIGKVGIAALTS
jgi:Yip1 domain